MKKINLLIALGLMASASMQAQTTIASLGFEENDTKGRSSEWAITPGLSTFGDLVNVKNQAFMDNEANKVVSYDEVDAWNEQYKDEVHSGTYALQAVNATPFQVLSPKDDDPEHVEDYKAATWDRGFKIANLPIQQDKSYRVSFWIKGDEGARCSSWLSQGIENFDASVRTASNYKYGIDNTELSGEWQFMSFVAFVNSDCTNKGMESWTGSAKVAENFGGDGTKTYRQFFNEKLPDEYFFIVNMFTSGATYLLDDIKIEEDAYINKVYFNYFDASTEANANVLKLDFGYQTNAKALAQSVGGIYVLDTEKAGVSVTVNGEPAEVFSMEAHEDGNVYIFLDEDELTYDGTAKIVVSYTPSADSPLLYEGQVRPSADISTPLQVKGFANEVAWFDETIAETSSLWAPPTVVSTVPENGSFELESATLTNIAVKFDKEVEVNSASAALEYKGTVIPLDDVQVDTTDPTVVNVAVSGLADGEYKFILSNVESAIAGISILEDVTIEFSVGEESGSGSGSFEEIWKDNIASVGDGQMPAGWTGNGESTNGGVVAMSAGGAPRTIFAETAKNHGIYISGRDKQIGTLAYGKAAIETIDAQGVMPEDYKNAALYLEAGKYNIYYRMALWDQNNGSNGQTITMAVYDAEDKAALEPTVLTVTDQVKNAWAGDATWLTGETEDGLITKRSQEVTIPATGYYYIEFATNSTAMAVSYFLTGLSIESKPSSTAAEQKAKLAAAVEKYQPTMDKAEGEEYDGTTKDAFVSAFDKAKNGHFTSISTVDAAIAELDAAAAKMQARIKNYDDFATSVETASAAYETLEGEKYLNSDIAKNAKELIDQYATVDPSTLSDEDLAEAAPKLVTAAAQIGNAKAVVDVLTWRAYKAGVTADKLGLTGAERDALKVLSSDDTKAINAVNFLSTVELYKALAENPDLLNGDPESKMAIKDEETGEITGYEPLKTTVNYVAGQKSVIDDVYVEMGADEATSGIDLSCFVDNPKFYTYARDNGANIESNTVKGWQVEKLEGYGLHLNGEATSDALPVVNTKINAYGGGAEYKFYQVIENAPVGVYDVYLQTRTALKNTQPDPETDGIGVFNAMDEEGVWDKYIFAQVDDEDPIMVPFSAGDNWGGYPTVVKNVEVGEGQTLTIGVVEHLVSGKASSHKYEPTSTWETNTTATDARLYFVAPLDGYDYAKAAEDLVTSVENIEAAAAKGSDAIYNLAGQRVDASYKGIVIKNGKKYMVK